MNIDTIKKAFEIVEKKGKTYLEKYDSNWISYTDKDGCIYTFDYFGYDDFCEDCIDKKIKEINKRINKKDPDVIIPDDFAELCYQTVSDKEGTDFCFCVECGGIIHQSNLWTSQEIEHWLKVMDDKDWKRIKNDIDKHYLLMKILDPDYGTAEEFPDETLKIAEKVIIFML